MDRDQLTERHAAVIRRHYRTLTDNGGQPTAQMLADLAAIADEHAAQLAGATPGPGQKVISGAPPSKPAPAPRQSAPRRTPARKTAK